MHRLAGTTAAMAAVAGVLAVLAPPSPGLPDAVLAAQETADTAGAEALLLAAAGLLAWACVDVGSPRSGCSPRARRSPGVLGGALRGSAGPGWSCPGSARRAAALALGLGLGLTGPVAGTALAGRHRARRGGGDDVDPRPGLAQGQPRRRGGARPAGGCGRRTARRPGAARLAAPPAAGGHVVVRGDCLWDVAAARLADQLGRPPTTAETARATTAWWAANADSHRGRSGRPLARTGAPSAARVTPSAPLPDRPSPTTGDRHDRARPPARTPAVTGTQPDSGPRP